MSLMRLLAVGSSLRGLKDRRSPYKMTQQHLLPKFGATTSKGTESKSAPAPGIGVALPKAQSPCEGFAKCARPAGDNERGDMKAIEITMRDESAGTAMAEEAASPTPAQSAEVGNSLEVAARKRSWNLGEITRLWHWARSKNPFQSKASDQKEPVQAELRLDAIQVVRNDLNEADLEVIAPLISKSSVPVKQPADYATQQNPENTRLVWQRIATRLFGSRPT